MKQVIDMKGMVKVCRDRPSLMWRNERETRNDIGKAPRGESVCGPMAATIGGGVEHQGGVGFLISVDAIDQIARGRGREMKTHTGRRRVIGF